MVESRPEMDWRKEIEDINSGLAEFTVLREAQLNWKPDPASWSIAQQFDHLIRINSSYFHIIDEIRGGHYQVPWLGSFALVYRWMGKLILNSVKPENTRKTKTFPIWEPVSSEIAGDIMDRFIAHQEELAEWMESCHDLVQAGQVIHSPANRNIVYTLDMAFRIILTHERRHILAARYLLHRSDEK